MPQRLKVLLSAYACEPNRGSEPEVGWQWALQMARFHDVTVLTRANNREVIERELAATPGPHPSFLYYDLSRWLITLKRRGLPVAIYYLFWQWGARRFVDKRLREFDLIHHLTFNSFRQPGFWWNCGRPVLLGPLGGGQICPWRFLPSFGWKMIPEALRSLSVLAARAMPHLFRSFGDATKILVANQDTARRIPSRFHEKIEPFLEAGIPREQVRPNGSPPNGSDGRGKGILPVSLDPANKPSNRAGVKIIWVSRLEKIKACGLALRAFAKAREQMPELKLTIVGSGPDEAPLKQLAGALNIEQSVTWHGKVPKADIPALLQDHDLFLFTSVRDTSGNVLLEAMAAGLPAVTLRHHGAAEIATDETAIRVTPTGFERTASDLAGAILKLAGSAELRHRLGAAGRQRILDHFVWEKKGERMDGIYEKVTGHSV